jgi:hypothetical protein
LISRLSLNPGEITAVGIDGVVKFARRLLVRIGCLATLMAEAGAVDLGVEYARGFAPAPLIGGWRAPPGNSPTSKGIVVNAEQ